MHIFIFGIRTKNFKKYSKGVRVIISTSIINNYQESIRKEIHTIKVNSLKNKVGKEISRILVELGNPLFGKFKQSIITKVILVRHSFHKRSKYNKPEKLIPLIIYVFLTLNDFKVNKSDLIQVSEIFYVEFNCFFYQLKKYMINYYRCDNYA